MAVKYFVAAVALVCLLPIARSEEVDAKKVQEKMAAMIKECQTKTGASDADIDAMRNRKTPESKEGKCMFECIFSNAGIIKDGAFNEEGLVTALTPMVAGDEAKVAKVKEMAGVCGKEIAGSTGDKCEIALKLMDCTVVKGKEFGFQYSTNF